MGWDFCWRAEKSIDKMGDETKTSWEYTNSKMLPGFGRIIDINTHHLSDDSEYRYGQRSCIRYVNKMGWSTAICHFGSPDILQRNLYQFLD